MRAFFSEASGPGDTPAEIYQLFQENVGADRLSDMIATLILKDIQTYTKRINSELEIDQTQYENLSFNGETYIRRKIYYYGFGRNAGADWHVRQDYRVEEW